MSKFKYGNFRSNHGFIQYSTSDAIQEKIRTFLERLLCDKIRIDEKDLDDINEMITKINKYQRVLSYADRREMHSKIAEFNRKYFPKTLNIQHTR